MREYPPVPESHECDGCAEHIADYRELYLRYCEEKLNFFKRRLREGQSYAEHRDTEERNQFKALAIKYKSLLQHKERILSDYRKRVINLQNQLDRIRTARAPQGKYAPIEEHFGNPLDIHHCVLSDKELEALID